MSQDLQLKNKEYAQNVLEDISLMLIKNVKLNLHALKDNITPSGILHADNANNLDVHHVQNGIVLNAKPDSV